MNVWPINAASDDGFLFAQVLFSALAFAAALAAQKAIAQWLDPKQPGAIAGPGGGVMPAVATTIGVGSLPRGDDVFVVAAARGPDRLASALLAGAAAEGWLVVGNDGRCSVLRDAKPAMRGLVALHRELARFPKPIPLTTCIGSAKRVAIEKLSPQLAPELERLGLRRSLGARLAMAVPAIVAGIALLEIANARWGFTGVDDGRIGGVMFVGAFACVLLAFNPDRRTVAWNRYVGWLWESTQALRDDVVDGQRDAADEVALAAALEGVVGYGPTPFAPRSAVGRTLEAMPGARKRDAA